MDGFRTWLDSFEGDSAPVDGRASLLGRYLDLQCLVGVTIHAAVLAGRGPAG